MTAKKKKVGTKKAASKKAAKKITAIRIEPELWAEASKVADLQGTTTGAVLAQCLKAGLPRLRKSILDFQSGEDSPE